MTAGIKANVDGSAAIQVGGTDVITLTSGGAASFAQPANLPNTFGFKNRIINGAMVIDQRNNGASVTPTADQTYTLDRWMIRNLSGAGRFSVVQSSTSAANFPTSVLLTVTTTSAPSGVEFYGLSQNVEGYNMADFGWGTANAQSVTVSFRVRSSLTGTYCVSLRNSGGTRSYVAEFTISAANTFETKTITIEGDTSGTWLTTNGIGIIFHVCLGSGASREGTANSWQGTNIVATSNQVDWINTSSATFYITGVQLEKGSTATSFDYRPYTTELQLCQRYLPAFNSTSTASAIPGSGIGAATTFASYNIPFMVLARVAPTGVSISSGAHFSLDDAVTLFACDALSFNFAGNSGAQVLPTRSAAGLTQFRPYNLRFNNASGQLLFTGCEL
jgi:hypothetical protein